MSFNRKRKSETELNMPLIRKARNQSADEKSDQIKDQTSKVPRKIESVKCTFCERSSLIKIKTFKGALKHKCGLRREAVIRRCEIHECTDIQLIDEGKYY